MGGGIFGELDVESLDAQVSNCYQYGSEVGRHTTSFLTL